MRLRFLPVLALFLIGCGDKPLPMATTPDKAKAALTTTLDAWKAGKTADDLKGLTPPIYFKDGDFTKGRKLTDYTIEGDGSPLGTGMRYDVTLTFADDGKGKKNAKIAYRVVTDPNTAIYREDF
jgi:hypothetical protein